MDLTIDPKSRRGGLAGIQSIVILSQCLSGGDVAMMTVSLAGIGRQLHAGPDLIQWILSASFLTFGGFLILAGQLVDRFGVRRMFTAGAAVVAIGLLPGVLTDWLFFIIAGRVLVGLGNSCVGPSAVGVIVGQFPEGTPRDKAFALFSLGQSLGFWGGLIIGGLITARFGWHAAFIVDFLIAGVNLLLGLTLLPRTASQGSLRGLDLPGAFTVTVGIGLLIYALSSLGHLGLGAPRVVASLIGSMLVLALFVRVELKSPHPLLSFAIFKEKNVTISIILLLFFNGLSIAVLVPTLLYAREIGHLAPASVVLLFIPPLLISLVAVRLMPRALQQFSSRTMVIAGFVPFLGPLLPALGAGQAAASPGLAVAFALLMVCCSTTGSLIGIVTIFAETTANAPLHQRGVVSAILLAISQIGGAVGIAVSASTMAVHAAGAEENFRLTFLCIASGGVICALLGASFFRYGPPRAVIAHH